jgi:hypothetical protein
VLRLARDLPRTFLGLGEARFRERRPHSVSQPICQPHFRNRVPARRRGVTKKKRTDARIAPTPCDTLTRGAHRRDAREDPVAARSHRTTVSQRAGARRVRAARPRGFIDRQREMIASAGANATAIPGSPRWGRSEGDRRAGAPRRSGVPGSSIEEPPVAHDRAHFENRARPPVSTETRHRKVPP